MPLSQMLHDGMDISLDTAWQPSSLAWQQHSAAQRSTAQHGAAPHSTAQHSPAQPSPAQPSPVMAQHPPLTCCPVCSGAPALLCKHIIRITAQRACVTWQQHSSTDLEGGWGARGVLGAQLHARQVEHGLQHPVLIHWTAGKKKRKGMKHLSALTRSLVITPDCPVTAGNR